MADKFIRRLFSLIIILLMVVPNFIIPVSADTEAKLVFSKDFLSPVNYVDTDINGGLTFAGLDNGSIIGMDQNGIVIYNYLVSSIGDSSIQKIDADDNGNVAFLTKYGDTGFLSPTGVLLGNIPKGGYQTRDIAIGRNDNMWFVTYNSTGGAVIGGYSPRGGGAYSQRYLYYTGSNLNILPQIEYDSVNGLLVATNETYLSGVSNKIYLYNITNYTGWLNFNPSKLSKNTTLQLLDSFPYRQNISYNNGDTATVGLIFLNNVSPSCNNITMYANGTFSFNVTRHGSYFFWGYPNNANISQRYVNLSYYNVTSKKLTVSTFPLSPGDNYTFYFGKSSYNNLITNQSMWYTNNNTVITQIFTYPGTTWTVPTGVSGVNLTMYGGGGGGGAGQDYESIGSGGDASVVTTHSMKVAPGSSATITIGAGGAGSAPAWTPPTPPGSTGGTTTFNNGTAIVSAYGGVGGYWGRGGAGQLGYTGVADYPTATTGQNGLSRPWNCAGGTFITYGAAGGYGFGAGGGGGGGSNYPTYYCSQNMPGYGGQGAPGLLIASFYVNDIPQYYSGTTPNSPNLSIQQDITIDTTIALAGNLSLTGNQVTAISIPEGGGIVGASTTGANPSADTGKIYHQEITSMGFGAASSATTDTGIGAHLATSDGGTYSVEARGSRIEIYPLNGDILNGGDYATGGTVNSVDIAARNGLIAVGGGNDGIFYIFDKLLVSQWEVYFQGDAVSPIASVAISEGGEYAAVGRTDGAFEYYNTRSAISAIDAVFSVDIFVTKGGASYPYINVSITQLTNGVPVSGSNVTNRTDSGGKFVFTATEQEYYLINVNDGEHTQIYQASIPYRVIAINLPFPLMTRPFQYGATYDSNANVITSTYADVNNAYVNLSVIDTASKTLIYSQTYPSTTGFTNNYVVPDANRTYQVQYNIVRTTGAKYDDTIYLQSTSFYQIPKNTSDQYTLFIYAIYTLMLMVVALSIGTQSLKYGTVMLVALTFLGITLGFLPLSLYTAGIATSAFIALLEVYRRRE